MADIFNKDLPHACSYCVYGRESLFSGEILCSKRGVTSVRDSCRKYKYDPLKRVPERVKISAIISPRISRFKKVLIFKKFLLTIRRVMV